MGGTRGAASGFTAGAAVSKRLGNLERLAYAAVLDYQYVTDRYVPASGAVSVQTLSRVGLSLELSYLSTVPPPPAPKYGSVWVTLLDASNGAPLANIEVHLVSSKDEAKATTNAEGKAQLGDLKPGLFTARAVGGGYLPTEGTVTVVAGDQVPLELKAKRKVGSLAISVFDQQTKAPLSGVALTVGGRELVTDATGRVSVEELTPGPVSVRARKEAYREMSEAVSIVPQKKTELDLALILLVKRVPANITGLVRSTRGGSPISAVLEIPEASLSTRATKSGAFTFTLPGGTYSVLISAPGYRTQTKTVTVKDGDQAIFNVDLYPVP
jgi:hypothetical protein